MALLSIHSSIFSFLWSGEGNIVFPYSKWGRIKLWKIRCKVWPSEWPKMHFDLNRERFAWKSFRLSKRKTLVRRILSLLDIFQLGMLFKESYPSCMRSLQHGSDGLHYTFKNYIKPVVVHPTLKLSPREVPAYHVGCKFLSKLLSLWWKTNTQMIPAKGCQLYLEGPTDTFYSLIKGENYPDPKTLIILIWWKQIN